MDLKEEIIEKVKRAGLSMEEEKSILEEIEEIWAFEDSLDESEAKPASHKTTGSVKVRGVKHIDGVPAQPCVKCPATGMITFQCWDCELFIGGYKNGDVKCGYPFEKPLDLYLFKVEPDATRWNPEYHLRKTDLVYGHPALYEFAKIYECEIGKVWDTWVRDKSKLESRPESS